MNANVKEVVSKYRQLRDKVAVLKAEHAKQLTPYVEAMQTLEDMAKTIMHDIGADSIKTDMGTMYTVERRTYSVFDADAFMQWVLKNGRTDMLERRVAKAAVDAYADETQQLPPGVTRAAILKVNFRK